MKSSHSPCGTQEMKSKYTVCGNTSGGAWRGNCKLVYKHIQRAKSEAETMADRVLSAKAVCGFHGLSNSRNIHESQ